MQNIYYVTSWNGLNSTKYLIRVSFLLFGSVIPDNRNGRTTDGDASLFRHTHADIHHTN